MKVLLATALLGAAGTGVAGEEAKHVMAIEIAGDGTADSTAFQWNSEELGFELDELQVGETRSIVDEDGRPILITRTEDGFSFNVDGKVIDLPDFHAIDGDNMHWVSDEGETDVNVHFVKKSEMAMSESNGTVIISSTPIDETTRQSIQAILETAGYGADVEFVDHSGSENGQVFIKKVEKVVDQS